MLKSRPRRGAGAAQIFHYQVERAPILLWRHPQFGPCTPRLVRLLLDIEATQEVWEDLTEIAAAYADLVRHDVDEAAVRRVKLCQRLMAHRLKP